MHQKGTFLKYFTLITLVLLFSQTIHSKELDVATIEKQAIEGDVNSQYKFGTMYDSGSGVTRSRNDAEKWYTKAAENGHAEAQNSLGSGYQAEQKYTEARKWYELAANQNHALATNNLAMLYDLGLGVTQNRQKGLKLYTRAAELGWPEAMWNIANMYGAGQLGEKDMFKACVWSFRAKNNTNNSLIRLNKQLENILPHLKDTLTSEQFNACQLEAKQWQR